MKRENDVLKADNTQLRTSNDTIKDDITQLKAKQKGEIGQLTALMDEMADNNKSQSIKIDTMRGEIRYLQTDNDMVKAENVQLKIEIDDLRRGVDTSKLHPKPLPRTRQKLKVSQWSGIT